MDLVTEALRNANTKAASSGRFDGSFLFASYLSIVLFRLSPQIHVPCSHFPLFLIRSFRQKLKKTENSNLHGFEPHRLSSNFTKLLFQIIKAIINHHPLWLCLGSSNLLFCRSLCPSSIPGWYLTVVYDISNASILFSWQWDLCEPPEAQSSLTVILILPCCHRDLYYMPCLWYAFFLIQCLCTSPVSISFHNSETRRISYLLSSNERISSASLFDLHHTTQSWSSGFLFASHLPLLPCPFFPQVQITSFHFPHFLVRSITRCDCASEPVTS